MRPEFVDLPDHLRAEIAEAWGVSEPHAAEYFDSTTAAWRWDVICAYAQADHLVALRTYFAQADYLTLRDLGHLLLAQSRRLEAAA